MNEEIRSARVIEIKAVWKEGFYAGGDFRESTGVYEPPFSRPDRWIIWATTDRFSRVWIRTVEDDGSSRGPEVRIRSLLVKEFFIGLLEQEISYIRNYEGYQACYSVCENTLQNPYHLSKFSEICSWFEKNRPELLENPKLLRRRRKETVAKEKRLDKTTITESEGRIRKTQAMKIGLPENASLDEIRKQEKKAKEEERKIRARTIGLPEDASWEKIQDAEFKDWWGWAHEGKKSRRFGDSSSQS